MIDRKLAAFLVVAGLAACNASEAGPSDSGTSPDDASTPKDATEPPIDGAGLANDAAPISTDCGMFPCFEDLYPHSPLLAHVPADPPLDPNDATIVDTLFNRKDGLRASYFSGISTAITTHTGTFPLYVSDCSDRAYGVHIGQPLWLSNQPDGQMVHFPQGAIPENISDAHLSVFDACPATYGVWDFWSSSTPEQGQVSAATGSRVPAYSVPAGCVKGANAYTTCAVDGLGSAEGHGQFASAAVVRAQEIVNGAIHHAVLLGSMCTAAGSGIFPAASDASDAPCPTGGDSGPHAIYGQRVFLDLTPAAIDPFFTAAEAWKKVYWVALATFGGYVSDTGWVLTQSESNLGYLALGKTSPWATAAAKFGWKSANGAWSFDFAPDDDGAWSQLRAHIHVIARSAPPPVGP